jgi:hypothetical protein
MKTKLASMVLLACALPACASQSSARGKPAASLGYSDGKYFSVRHSLPDSSATAPTGAWHADAGRILGNVCGVDVDFQGEYWGHRLDVSGFTALSPRLGLSTNAHPMRFDVRDGKHGRQIFGTLPDNKGLTPIEIYLTPDSLVGTIGLRHYALTRGDDDELRGTLRTATFMGDRTMPFVIRGAQELWQMPASDQAVLVPLMLSCLQGMPGNRRSERFVLGVDFRNQRAELVAPISDVGPRS